MNEPSELAKRIAIENVALTVASHYSGYAANHAKMLADVERVIREQITAPLESEIVNLKAELRECAMATGSTTGDEQKDADSLVEPVMCLPLETAALVSDRISDRDIQIASLESELAAAKAEAERLRWDYDDCRAAMEHAIKERDVWKRESLHDKEQHVIDSNNIDAHRRDEEKLRSDNAALRQQVEELRVLIERCRQCMVLHPEQKLSLDIDAALSKKVSVLEQQGG